MLVGVTKRYKLHGKGIRDRSTDAREAMGSIETVRASTTKPAWGKPKKPKFSQRDPNRGLSFQLRSGVVAWELWFGTFDFGT